MKRWFRYHFGLSDVLHSFLVNCAVVLLQFSLYYLPVHQISGGLDVARHALLQIAARLKANFFEREGALSAFPPVIPYHPLPAGVSDEPKYISRDTKPVGHYLYSSGFRGSDDLIPSDSYGSYSSSQV
jgi:poly(rC)-binding protein 2/3/4